MRVEDEAQQYSERAEAACLVGKSFFVTHEGSMGLCLPEAKPGDVVVFFADVPLPSLLRGLGDGTYVGIGECYLYD